MKPQNSNRTNLARRIASLAGMAALLLSATAPVAHAGSFSTDFNSGLPPGTTVYGNAGVLPTGGVTNSGFIQLTSAVASTNGAFIINTDLDSGTPVASFMASFQVLIGGGNGADGFSFNFASDLPAGGFAEDGGGTGLSVTFDTFDNGAPDYIGIGVKVGGTEIAQFPFTGLRANTFVDVVVQLHPDGTLDVVYDGTYAFKNLNTGYAASPGSLFGFGARTGGSYDNHWLDNLNITTRTTAGAFLDYFYPVGRNVRADAPLNLVVTDNGTALNTSSIVLKLDGTPVTPSITPSGVSTTIAFQPPAILLSGSTHIVSVTFADNATPTPNTTTFQYEFTVASYSSLPSRLAADPSFVNLTAPGFFIRYSQIADEGSREITRAELQLANLLIDGSSGLPYANLAAPNPQNSTFTRLEPAVINFGYPAGATGNFPNDTDVPGLPGPTTGNGNSYAMDAVSYLHLAPGLYNLGVNSSDGFKLMAADSADIFAPQESIYSGVRAAADTTVAFSVDTDGYYPFRLVYFTGDPAYAPAPGTTTPSVEFFNITKNGDKVLINDVATSGYVPAFAAAKTKPYVRSVVPAVNDTGVAGDTTITATLVDQSLTVVNNSIELQVNGTIVTPSLNSAGGITTVSYKPATVFLPNSSNYVSLAFTDSGSNRRTNTWSFTVANIMTPSWSIPAVNNTWVTAGSTERGLAYNPKTGHLLLVSRATNSATANGLGIAILSSTNGALLGTMNIGDIATTGGGTFKLSMIDVADDGVIYVCNLSTSSSQPFIIYRWQNETATPTIAFQQNPPFVTGAPSRVGDDFRVRGSGSGTQIIASGNSAVTTIPLFTTTDGVTFTPTTLSIAGIGANMTRLGLDFGCGNTLYGETTGQPMSYVGFNGAPSTTATLLASYGIYDKNTNQAIGPIAIDIVNQRLIGNQTVAPHNINLYDLGTLATTPTKNFPIDQRNYASQNTSFGTGSVDFTPDGSKVFCLDTGNGIIAFDLAPRVAAPVICAQPQTNIVSGPGALGFMDVTVIGAPQKFQWRLNGTPIANATGRTLDIPNVQDAQLGFYSVVITNPALGLSVTSAPAVLDTRMAITNPDKLAPVGGSVAMTATVVNGLAPYTYQWQFNGNNVGANSSSYTIASAGCRFLHRYG